MASFPSDAWDGGDPARPMERFRISDGPVSPRAHAIELEGECDLYAAPLLRERIARAAQRGKRLLPVDLSELTSIDAAALDTLIGEFRRLRGEDQWLELVCPNPDIRKLFELTGLDRVMAIHGSHADALAGRVAASWPYEPGGESGR